MSISAVPGRPELHGGLVAAGRERASIGRVEDIGASSAICRIELAALHRLQGRADSPLALAGSIGSLVKMKVGEAWLLADIREMKVDPVEHGWIVVDADFLGEGSEAPDGRLRDFRRGVSRYPRPGDEVHAVTRDDLVQVFAADDRPHIEIGTVHPTADVRAAMYVDPMLGKHFILMGATGTGKSTLAALMLHRLAEMAPEGHIVVLDPHGEYGSAFSSRGVVFNVDNLALPYWLMNFEDHCDVFIASEGEGREINKDMLAKCLLFARSRSDAAASLDNLTVDSPVPYLMSDLLAALRSEMGKLEKGGNYAHYVRLKTRIEEINRDPRYTFMFGGMLRGDTMVQFLARVLRLPGQGKPISVVDLSGVPSEIVNVVVALLSRLILDYAIWSRSEPRRPILLVCDEAQRYLSQEHLPSGEAVRRILVRIAKEGRKYGVALGLITQRPSDLAEGAISQCSTFISMRLNNRRDQSYVREALPEDARGLLEAIPVLGNRECIVCGEGASLPMRVRVDDVEEAMRPESADPVFSQLWTEAGDEAEILRRTVHRWRTQRR